MAISNFSLDRLKLQPHAAQVGSSADLGQFTHSSKTSTAPIVNTGSAIMWTTRITTTCAGLVILAAGILGYTALRDLFVSTGLFAAWLALLFPLLFPSRYHAPAWCHVETW